MAKKKSFQINHSLASGLEETITAAQSYSGELRVDVIPLKKIDLDPANPRDLAVTPQDLFHGLSKEDVFFQRKNEEITSLQSMANSIQEQGIINPILVYKYGEHYRLVAGERRTLASILAGKSDIQAKILDGKPSELKLSLLQWIENIERSDLSLWEKLRNLNKIISAYADIENKSLEHVTVTELSRLIGCTKPYAMSYKAVLTADEDIKQLIFENKIKNLEKAAVLASITSAETKQQAIHACLMGMPLKKLKVLAEHGKKERTLSLNHLPVHRGRQARAVNFGSTKNMQVAKLIIESVLHNKTLSYLAPYFKEANLNNYQSITSTFKNLIKKLEELNE